MRDSQHLNTKLIGLIGHPIKQTYSPFIHNVAIELTKIDYLYLPFSVPSSSLKNAVRGLLALGLKGFNVTLPHKVKVIEYLSQLSEEASLIGAVNTIVNEDGKLIGYNTDAFGVTESLAPHKSKFANKEVAVIGAGGSANAVVFSLIRNFKPKKIHLINRTEQRAETLVQYFKTKMKFDGFVVHELIQPDLISTLNKCKLIINTTPIGMFPETDDAIITSPDAFTREHIVFDLVYNPIQTKFLNLAKSKGAEVIDGTRMLVLQASKSFELWTGLQMPIDEVYHSLQHFINE